jgi:Ca2+-binding EF-hand superfamily protein
VFSNLGIDLVKDELEALFNEIDVDKSNTIDIDELIYFMTKNQSNINPLAASALMNVSYHI